MTAGFLLVACVGLPAVAALILATTGLNTRSEQATTTIAGVLVLLVAVVVAAMLMSSRSPTLQAHLVMTGWKLTPSESAPTVTLHLARPWAFAPVLTAAFALLLITNDANRSWHLHLQHAAAQGSLVATTPELGLAMVTTSTVGAAMRLASRTGEDGTRGLSTALRWASADVLLWIWTAGFIGVGATVGRIAAAALMVRASVFPFQGALARSVTGSRDAGLLFVPFPVIVWAVRWMDADAVPNGIPWQLLAAAMVLVPAVLAWASRNDEAAKTYGLTSLIVWPIAFWMPGATAIALIALGTAAVLCRPSSSWGLIASAASVVVPTLAILAMARSGEASSTHLLGWAIVSLAAILMHQRRAPQSSLRRSETHDWPEAVLVILSLAAFLAPLMFGAAATVEP